MDLQRAAATRLEESRMAASDAKSEGDEAKKLKLLLKARANAEEAKTLSQAAANLAVTSWRRR